MSDGTPKRRSSRATPARAAAIGAVMVALVALLLAQAGDDGAPEPRGRGGGGPVEERFAVLSTRASNRCDLTGEELAAMAEERRLQGSCCFPMDLHRYREQVEALEAYAAYPEIPPDPYDISVAHARRLLEHREIALSPTQRLTYRRAVERSENGGPCCCPCWRWDAFEGLGRYLIAERGFGARRVAAVWDLLDGCGGAGHRHA